jgi:hypothetical protein
MWTEAWSNGLVNLRGDGIEQRIDLVKDVALALLGDDGWMNARRVVLLVTCLVVAGLGGMFVLTQWDRVNRIATVLSALAAVAAVGVAVWAALVSGSGPAVRVVNTGPATAGHGGRATSGLTGSVSALLGPIDVDGTGNADASGGGDATTGVHLT